MGSRKLVVGGALTLAALAVVWAMAGGVRGKVRGPAGLLVQNWPNGNAKIKEQYDKEGHPIELWLYRQDGTMAVHGNFKWNAAAHAAHEEFHISHPYDWGKDFDYRDYHGLWTYTRAEGEVIAEGEWRDGRPWNGDCRTRVIVPGPASLEFYADYYVIQRYSNGEVIAGSSVRCTAEGE